MLANSFMKAEALGITEAEVAALVHVLGMMDREELRDTQADRDERGFCMSSWPNLHDCGTPACIGGWASRLLGYDWSLKDDGTAPGAHDLFFPTGADWRAISMAKATIALRNYLTTGEARWAEVLAE